MRCWISTLERSQIQRYGENAEVGKSSVDWIPFQDGAYRLEQAYLVAGDNAAVSLLQPYLEVFTGRTGKRWMKGGSLVEPVLVVELLETDDHLDILLSFGEPYHYLMRKPEIQAGKMFVPNVKSSLKFMPTVPWQALSEESYRDRLTALKLLRT
jgi:hypothetical protein